MSPTCGRTGPAVPKLSISHVEPWLLSLPQACIYTILHARKRKLSAPGDCRGTGHWGSEKTVQQRILGPEQGVSLRH